ncbi:MAG: Zn-dependent hydrolase [Rhodospirillaceae bacterium]|nr:Zn-dependent hydrolase [Rhodospirillaceae bacterium]
MSAPKEISLKKIANHVDEKRLWGRLMDLGKIGATKNDGVCRLALTDEEIKARQLLIDWAKAMGLSVYTDAISNLFFRYEGLKNDEAPVVTGSHIDSQPTGGKFDGAFGVVAGFEVIAAMQDSGFRPQAPLEIAVWLNEEGSRFSPGMMGSEAFTSRRSMEQILVVEDADGVKTEDALAQTLASFPDIKQRPLGFPIKTFIEAHIEQGPILEAHAVSVGVVTGIQGSRRYRVKVVGEDGHAGTLPTPQRKDALFAAIEMIRAMRHKFDVEDMKYTVGLFEVSPNVPSVIPSTTFFSIDLRHPDWQTLKDMGDLVMTICEQNKGPCTVTVTEIATSESLEFPSEIRECISAAADEIGIANMPILSMAGHDARQLHYHCPTGMIFSPCDGGISHNEMENCNPSDLAEVTCVLAGALAKLSG